MKFYFVWNKNCANEKWYANKNIIRAKSQNIILSKY